MGSFQCLLWTKNDFKNLKKSFMKSLFIYALIFSEKNI